MSAAHAPADAARLARSRANRRGIAWMCAAMSVFIVNDALVKFVSERVPTAQLIFVRGLIAVVLVALAAQQAGVLVRAAEIVRGRVAVRATIEAIAAFLYLAALFKLPIANATAINLASPLVIAVLATIFLGERVGPRRWLAIGLGFAGVLLVIQPRADGFNAYAWLCLLSTLFHATRDLITRGIPPGTPSILVTLATTVAVVLLSGIATAVEGWQPMSWSDTGWLGLASVFLASGYYAMISGVRQGEVSVVAPFRYTGLLWALVIGFVVWGDVPNALAFGGIALLIGAGLYMLHQERGR